MTIIFIYVNLLELNQRPCSWSGYSPCIVLAKRVHTRQESMSRVSTNFLIAMIQRDENPRRICKLDVNSIGSKEERLRTRSTKCALSFLISQFRTTTLGHRRTWVFSLNRRHSPFIRQLGRAWHRGYWSSERRGAAPGHMPGNGCGVWGGTARYRGVGVKYDTRPAIR